MPRPAWRPRAQRLARTDGTRLPLLPIAGSMTRADGRVVSCARPRALYPTPRFAKDVDGALVLNLGVSLAILTLGLSLMLLLVSVVSWLRLRTAKLLFAGGAFLVLALQGALWTWRGIVQRETDLLSLGLDFAVLGFLYASVAKR